MGRLGLLKGGILYRFDFPLLPQRVFLRTTQQVSLHSHMATDEHADKKRKADTLTGEASETSEVEVRKMVQTLSVDQLSNLVVTLCAKNADACAMLHEAWSRDLNNRKLYIRNLNVRLVCIYVFCLCVSRCACFCCCRHFCRVWVCHSAQSDH